MKELIVINGFYILKNKSMKKKMDHILVSKQKSELAFVASRFKCPQKEVKEVQSLVGRSRGKVYAELKRRGWELRKR